MQYKMLRLGKKNNAVYLIGVLFLAMVAGVGILIKSNQESQIEYNAYLVETSNKAAISRSNNSASLLSESNKVTVIAVGDIMLSRTTGQKIRTHGISYPFEKTSDILGSGDFSFGNLETSITEGPIVKTGSMMFRADPGVEQALAENEFQVLSLANNHTPNYGQKGLLDTFNYLEKAKIEFVGAGRNSKESRTPKIIDRSEMQIAFLAYNDTDVVPDSYEAGANTAGTAFMNIATIKDDIDYARQQSDVVIVSMHSGIEYTPGPNHRQIEFAHAAIDAGAEIVIGHHPHVVQSVEEYRGKLIIYSLGNFIFDQMWSVETQQGMIAKITFIGSSVSDIYFIPVMIEDYAQPRPAQAEEADVILGRLQLEKIGHKKNNWTAANPLLQKHK